MSSDYPIHILHPLGILPYLLSHPGFSSTAHPHFRGLQLLLDPALPHEPSEPFLLYLPSVLWAWLQGHGAGQILGYLW